VEVDAGSRQHPAFDVRSTVSRRNDANHASRVSVLALRGENGISSSSASRRRRGDAHPGRGDVESRRCPFEHRAPLAVRLEHLVVIGPRGQRLGFKLPVAFRPRPIANACPREGATRRRTDRGAFHRWARIRACETNLAALSSWGRSVLTNRDETNPRTPFQPLGSLAAACDSGTATSGPNA
jgi:hypothetical protein